MLGLFNHRSTRSGFCVDFENATERASIATSRLKPWWPQRRTISRLRLPQSSTSEKIHHTPGNGKFLGSESTGRFAYWRTLRFLQRVNSTHVFEVFRISALAVEDKVRAANTLDRRPLFDPVAERFCLPILSYLLYCTLVCPMFPRRVPPHDLLR